MPRVCSGLTRVGLHVKEQQDRRGVSPNEIGGYKQVGGTGQVTRTIVCDAEAQGREAIDADSYDRLTG
jgi:hypothetical protein